MIIHACGRFILWKEDAQLNRILRRRKAKDQFKWILSRRRAVNNARLCLTFFNYNGCTSSNKDGGKLGMSLEITHYKFIVWKRVFVLIENLRGHSCILCNNLKKLTRTKISLERRAMHGIILYQEYIHAVLSSWVSALMSCKHG